MSFPDGVLPEVDVVYHVVILGTDVIVAARSYGQRSCLVYGIHEINEHCIAVQVRGLVFSASLVIIDVLLRYFNGHDLFFSILSYRKNPQQNISGPPEFFEFIQHVSAHDPVTVEIQTAALNGD